MQVDALERYAEAQGKALVLYVDKVSSRRVRPQLDGAMKAMTRGDVFAVYKLDRLARSTKELYELTDEMNNREVEFVSLSDNSILRRQ
ncbi:recombinase family protein [Paracerasibacillus soli]|uniref:Recombinase family protein n=1 Tax=Paracerasibacillus soli TaxID=480284 RepID=A0ABU5CUG5_9BACI|nr:recombinase family protein [Virgibacillus soli]MDY0409951.1 recombinase family protein [Virgibacillus soli]